MSLRIRNLSDTDYTTIQDIFKTGTDLLSPNYTNTSLTFTTVNSGINSSLVNSSTGFQVAGVDISTKYLAAYDGPYSQMSSEIDVNLDTTSAYRYVNFFLQAPGGSGGTNTGSGGSGAFVFGRVNLSVVTTAIKYTVYVPLQTNTTTASSISFSSSSGIIATISCARGKNGTFSFPNPIGGDGGNYTAPTVNGITYDFTLTGITGANSGGSVTKNPYIDANSSYNNTFQPITSSDDTSYGAGGKRDPVDRIGKPGLCYVWYTR